MTRASDERLPTEPANGAALAFFDRSVDAFERAASAAGGAVERHLRIAGRRVTLRFAGLALTPALLPALRHLAVTLEAGSAPSLTILAWDSESTGVLMPSPTWDWDEAAGIEIEGFTFGRIQASYQHGPGVFCMLDHERTVAVYWVKAARFLPQHEVAAPFRSLLQWWAADHGIQQVHGAAVGLLDGGVLLPGRGGSGKSTTALACLAGGLDYAGDDFCLVSAEGPPWAYSLYGSAKTHPHDLDRMPFLRDWAGDRPRPPDEKIVYFLDEHLPKQLVTGFPLRAILVPCVTGDRDTTIAPTTAAAAMVALAPSTLILTPSHAPATFAALARIVRRLPCYTLRLGTDIEQIPHAIRSFLVEQHRGVGSDPAQALSSPGRL